MSAVSTVLVLPDSREDLGVIDALNERLKALCYLANPVWPSRSGLTPRLWTHTAWGAGFLPIDGNAVVTEARKCDWEHPVLIVYKDQGDDRWSHALVGLGSSDSDEEE